MLRAIGTEFNYRFNDGMVIRYRVVGHVPCSTCEGGPIVMREEIKAVRIMPASLPWRDGYDATNSDNVVR